MYPRHVVRNALSQVKVAEEAAVHGGKTKGKIKGK